MSTKLAATIRTRINTVTDRFEDLLRNRDRGDGIQTAVIVLGGLLVATVLVAAFTAAITNRANNIK